MKEKERLVAAAEHLAEALDECGFYLRERCPEIVEPQLDAMSDDEARMHSLFHQTIEPAMQAWRSL